MARLAQTSIRFRDFEINQHLLDELGIEIDRVAATAAREIYGEGVEVDVVLEAASLLIRSTVIGGLLWGGYDAISKYPDFKAGIEELVKDAQHYGSTVYNGVLKLTGAEKADGFVKRDMTPGKISRVIQRLEKLQELEKHASSQVVQEELQRIAYELQAVERDLEPEERQFVEKQLELKGLPPPHKLPKPIPDHEERRVAIVRDREDRIGRAVPRSGEKRKKLRYHNRFRI
jgi:hypothetical protein